MPLSPSQLHPFVIGRVTQTGSYYNAYVLAPGKPIARAMAMQRLMARGLSTKVKPGASVTRKGVVPMPPVPLPYLLALPQFIPLYPPPPFPVGAYIVRYRIKTVRRRKASSRRRSAQQAAQAASGMVKVSGDSYGAIDPGLLSRANFSIDRRLLNPYRKHGQSSSLDEETDDMPLSDDVQAEELSLMDRWDDLDTWKQYTIGGTASVGLLVGLAALARKVRGG